MIVMAVVVGLLDLGVGEEEEDRMIEEAADLMEVVAVVVVEEGEDLMEVVVDPTVVVEEAEGDLMVETEEVDMVAEIEEVDMVVTGEESTEIQETN